MRLFVGVELSDAARAMTERVAGDLRRTLRKAVDARWLAIENMHVTVRFIGNVRDERATAVLDAICRPVTLQPFEIEFGDCGRFPPRGAPRVIWIGLTRGLQSLAALHDEFNRRLAPLGYEPENRPFSAHLTLARIKDARAAAARSLDAAFDSVRPATVKQTIETITIFESRLSSHGANYIPLRRLRLGS
jgi:RNA 2',3'-cyclic 3'-phosphodiesterase